MWEVVSLVPGTGARGTGAWGYGSINKCFKKQRKRQPFRFPAVIHNSRKGKRRAFAEWKAEALVFHRGGRRRKAEQQGREGAKPGPSPPTSELLSTMGTVAHGAGY